MIDISVLKEVYHMLEFGKELVGLLLVLQELMITNGTHLISTLDLEVVRNFTSMVLWSVLSLMIILISIGIPELMLVDLMITVLTSKVISKISLFPILNKLNLTLPVELF
jgi:hypothetical protein